MKTRSLFVILLCLSGCKTLNQVPLPMTGPEAVYLTWHGDPTTTMTVNWLSGRDATGDIVEWGPAGDDTWSAATGISHELPRTHRRVHTVQLQRLEPGSVYRFRVAGEDRVYRFRTMPADATEPIVFVAGGDVYRDRWDERIYLAAAARDPSFALIGGDVVYDNGQTILSDRWAHWLNAWGRTMVTPDGCLIPMVLAIGNHEVHGYYDQTPDRATSFYALFGFPGPEGRGVLDFGDYMSVIVLDSSHTHGVGGEQTQWLESVLAARTDVPHLFAIYHIPAFPSVRGFDGRLQTAVRTNFVPLFEQYGLDVAFENHDHAYKRTPLINGVLYLGDGCWGVAPRRVHDAARTWYLERSESRNHVFVTTIQGDTRVHEAIDPDGVIFDRFP